MSKPNKAIELPTRSDLTIHTYVRAFDLLQNAPDVIPPSDATHTFYQLRVSSQSLSFAAKITAITHNTTLMLDCNYEPEEWSLSRIAINGGGDRSDTQIWCPGA